MKIIKYNLYTRVNLGTEEEPNIKQIVLPAEIECTTQASFDANYPIAEKEAIPGTIEISGEFDSEPEVPTTLETRVGNLEADSTEMKEALDMILSGVTE